MLDTQKLSLGKTGGKSFNHHRPSLVAYLSVGQFECLFEGNLVYDASPLIGHLKQLQHLKHEIGQRQGYLRIVSVDFQRVFALFYRHYFVSSKGILQVSFELLEDTFRKWRLQLD